MSFGESIREWLLDCFKSLSVSYEIPEECYKKLLTVSIVVAGIVKLYVAVRDYFLNFSCLFPNDFLFFVFLLVSYLLVKRGRLEVAVNVLVLAILFTLTYCLLAGHYSSLFWFPLVPLLAGIFFDFKRLLFYAYIPVITNTAIFFLKFSQFLRAGRLTPNSPIVLGFEALAAYLTFGVAITVYRIFIDAYREGLKRLLEIDSLTTVLTRRSLFSRLEEIEKRCIPYAVLMLDIDFFKSVNDTFGHQVGDKVLREVSILIKSNLRRGDIVGRYGGEEFLIVLPGADRLNATAVAEKIRRLIEEHDFSIPRKVTVSLGVADSTEAEGMEDVIKLADERLYVAKRLGRNRVVNDTIIKQ